MFEVDGDGDWGVGREADSLTKSLFGGTAKKKRNQKASKNGPSISSSTVLDGSDDETFTKKGIRKLKEKRRKQKKKDKKGEVNLETSSNAEHVAENGVDLEFSETNTASKMDKIKAKKNNKNKATESDLSGGKVKKSNKRKKGFSEEDEAESQILLNKKRKKVNENDTSTNLTEETTQKKRRRNRKKKNNSKKNKYAHLALNRKDKEAVESAKEKSNGSLDKNASANTIDTPEKLSKKNKKDHTSKKGKVFSISNDSSETGKVAAVMTNGTVMEKAKAIKFETDVAQHDNPEKQKKTKLGTSHDSTEPSENTSLVMEKNRKRKGDTLSTSGIKIGKKNAEEGQTPNLTVLSQTKKKKKKDKAKSGTTISGVNAQLQDAGEKTTNVKDSKKVDPKKVTELKQRQRTLLQALGRSGSGQENLDFINLKEKKKKKKESKFKSSELQNTKPSPSNLKKQVGESSTKKSGATAQTDKSSAESLSKQKVGNSTLNKSSIWGGKASTLGMQAQEKLNAARFRYLNEQLYTCQGKEALQMFREDRAAFEVYHTGFENQASKWPVNPVNVLIKQLKNKSPNLVVADFGCGDAKLAQALTQKVHSFDLVALNPWVKACDMSKVPLQDESVDVAVFCLSLMGTNLDDYIREANRVLKTDGLLKIVEVVSRFKGLSSFLASVCSHGFQLLNKRDLSEMFYLMDFKKLNVVKKGATPKSLSLKPCLYKKR